MNNKLKKNLILIFLTVVSDFAAVSFIMPLLPFYAGNSNPTVYSFLFASYPAAQFIGFIPMGCLSDRFGRKRMILVALFGSILGAVLQMLSPSLGYLILFRFIAGFFGTTIVSCQAYVTDCVKREEKSQYLSRIIGCSTLAFSVGPFISSILYNFGTWIPFLMCVIVYSIIFVVDLLLLDDSPKFDMNNQRSSMRLLAHEDDVVITSEDTIAGRIPRGSSGTIEIYLPRISRQESYKSVENMNQYLTNISIYIICLLSLCDNVALMCNSSYLGKRIKDDYTNNQIIVAYIYITFIFMFYSGIASFNSFVLTIFQLFLFPLLCKYIYIGHTMFIGYVIQIIGWALILFTPFSIVLCGAVIHELGFGMTVATYSVLVSHIVSSENQGKILGTINTFTCLSQIISPIIFGGLYLIEHRVPFFVTTFISCACVLFLLMFYYTSRKNVILNEMKEECYNMNKRTES